VLRTVFRPWLHAGTTWRALAHLALDFPLGGLFFAGTFPLLIASVPTLIVLPVSIVISSILFLVTHQLARLERNRFAAVLGVTLVDQSAPLQGGWWSRYKQRLTSAARWKEIGYLLLAYPRGALMMGLALGTWAGSLALVFLPAYLHALPGGVAHFGLFKVATIGPAFLLALVGLAGVVLVAPWTTLGLAAADRFVARGLLGKPEVTELTERVSALETSRTAAVDSAETERRRIERDLHDGAQQRLIAVAMDLGRARTQLDQDPTRAGELVAGAHEEVKAAIKELRDLVRGFHPVILEDRGLDAALSAVVARSPVPVLLKVAVQPRPAAAIESAAYFIVSEALTNVARHAQATAASVEIARNGDRLTMAISDNGRGGADPDRGTGLTGLAERVAALGGWMQVLSPLGGPTTLLVEVPCGS
jgi:signal transduction histidine kinase